MKGCAVALGALALAFAGRVLGQFVVAVFEPGFLPPMEAWYSGLLPYRFLLPVQVVILVAQFEVSRQLWVGRGRLTVARPGLGRGLKWFALVYFLAMLVRYVAVMSLHPERRWFGGAIPILFHWVLAAWVYGLSRYHRGLVRGQ